MKIVHIKNFSNMECLIQEVQFKGDRYLKCILHIPGRSVEIVAWIGNNHQWDKKGSGWLDWAMWHDMMINYEAWDNHACFSDMYSLHELPAKFPKEP